MAVHLANFDYDYRIAPTANGQGIILPRRVYDGMSPLAGLYAAVVEPDDVIETVGFDPPDGPRHICDRIVRNDAGNQSDYESMWGYPPCRSRHAGEREAAHIATNNRLNWTIERWDGGDAGRLDRWPTIDGVSAWRIGLPFDDADAVLDYLAGQGGGDRLVKAAFSGFGRGNRRVYDGDIPRSLPGWLARCCDSGGVVVEPLLSIQCEFASHFFARDDGVVEIVGTSESVVDSQFQCRRVFADRQPNWRLDLTTHPVVRAACDRIVASGFRGPFSIDHSLASSRMIDDADVSRSWHLLQDVNGRVTVGSLAARAARRFGSPVAIVLGPPETIDCERQFVFVGSDGRQASLCIGAGELADR